MTQQSMVPLSSAQHAPHPRGHEGILTGLRKCASYIKEGRHNPDVISWAGHQLVKAGAPQGDLERAKALFKAFAEQYAYMKDTRGTERMVGAHLTLGDGKDKAPRFPGGDCDDAVIAYGSACEAAGIGVAIVGAAYDDEGNISHVLLLVSDGRGKWYYADPSAKGYVFGQAKKPTRELVVDVLTGDIMCDDTMCSPRLQGKVAPIDSRNEGRFYGLNDGEHSGHTFQEARSGMMLLERGQLGEVVKQGDVGMLNDDDKAWLTSIIDKMAEAQSRLKRAYKTGQDVADLLSLPKLGSPDNTLFGPSDLERSIDLNTMLDLSITAFQQVLSGQRTIGITEGGVFGPELIIEALDSDALYVGFDLKSRRPQLYRKADNAPVSPPGSLGVFPVIPVVVGVAVVSLSIAGSVIADAWSKAVQAQAAAEQATVKGEYDLIKAGKTDDLIRVTEARKQLEESKAAGTVGGQVKQGVDALTSFLKWVGVAAIAGGTVYGVSKLASRR